MKGMIGIKSKLIALIVMLGLHVGAGFGGHAAWVAQAPGADDQQPPVIEGKPAKYEAARDAINDLFGDPLPPDAVARLGTVRWRHAGWTTFAAFLPDGKSVLSVAEDKTIRVWEYPSGKELRRIGPVEGNTVWSPSFLVALSPDGKTVAICSARVVRLIDVATGKDVQNLNTAFSIRTLGFSPDGLRLAVLGFEPLKKGPVLMMGISIWDWANAKELRTFAFPRGEGGNAGDTLLWSPDGKALATIKTDVVNKKPWTETCFIQLWDPATGKELKTIPIPDIRSTSQARLVFSPDGKMLAMPIFNRGAVVLVDIASGRVRTWKHDLGPYTRLLFGGDSTKLYGCASFPKNIYQDEVKKSKLLRTDLHKAVVEWDARTGKQLRKLDSVTRGTFTFHGGANAAWSPDGKILVMAGAGNTLEFCDVAAFKWIDTDTASAFPLWAVQFTPDGKHLFSVHNGSIYKWDAVTSKQLASQATPLLSPDGKPTASGLTSPEGQALWTEKYRLGESWGRAADEKVDPLPAIVNSEDGAMLFSPDGKMAVRLGNTIKWYDVPTGKLLHTGAIANFQGSGFGDFQGGGFGIMRLMFFSPDSKLLAVLADGKTLGVWDTSSGQRIASLMPAVPDLPAGKSRETNMIQSGALSPDGRCVALDQNDGTVAVYELASGQVRRNYGIRVAGKDVRPFRRTLLENRVVFGKDGRTLLHAGLDMVVHVWDVASGKELAAFKGHSGAINSLARAPDGKTVASASADTTALIWDVSKIKRPAAPVKALKAGDLEKHWHTLADNDAGKAYDAIGDLILAPKDAVAFIKDRLKPTAPLDRKRVEKLIQHLDDGQFQMRDQATREMLKLGELIVPALDQALAAKAPLETRRRLEELRSKIIEVTGLALRGEKLRACRAVEVLEHVGTPQARQVLQALADGAPGALLSRAAHSEPRWRPGNSRRCYSEAVNT